MTGKYTGSSLDDFLKKQNIEKEVNEKMNELETKLETLQTKYDKLVSLVDDKTLEKADVT